MNDAFLTLLATPRRIDLFGLDDRGLFGWLARASSWSQTRSVLAILPASRRHLSFVAAGLLPPPSLLDDLAPDLDSLVLVPDNWLARLPRHQPRLRARHAARLAALHLDEPLHTVTGFDDNDRPC